MKFKALVVMFAIFSISLFAVVVSSCGDDDSPKINCSKVCAKEKECNKDMTDDDVKECETTCSNIKDNGYFQDSFVNTLNDCYDKPCSDIDSCLEKASESCKAADYMPYVNAICEKGISCGSNITKEECVNDGKKVLEKEIEGDSGLKCLTDKFFKDMADCIKKANCNTLEDDMEKCMEDLMDMK